jgi:hypothetical protein
MASFTVELGTLAPLLLTADVRSSRILFTLIMEVVRSSEMSVRTRATRRHIPQDSIHHGSGHRRASQNLKRI